MLDRSVFLRPMAHRGLHHVGRGLIENTAPAFAAAMAKGYGIECDLRPIRGGTPVVFHDDTLERLVDAAGPIAQVTPSRLKTLRHRAHDVPILTFAELLELVGGRVPLLIEIKSDWNPPNPKFLRTTARLAQAYKGPLAWMAFDPAVMRVMRELAPSIPRGIVAGIYSGDGWWPDKLDSARAWRLSHLLESGPVAPAFYSYDVKSLPTPVTRYVREVQGLPLYAWTVRTPEDRERADRWADAPTFESYEP